MSKTKVNNELKRYNLSLPVELYEAIEQRAQQRQTTILEMMRRFIRIGLLVEEIEDTPGAKLIIEEGETQRQIVLV